MGRQYVEGLRRLRFSSRQMQQSFERLPEMDEFFSLKVEKQTRLLKEPAASEEYRECALEDKDAAKLMVRLYKNMLKLKRLQPATALR